MSFLSLPSCLAMKDKDQMWEASQIFLPVPNQKRERKKVSNILCKYLASSRKIICQIVVLGMEMIIYPVYYWTLYNQQIEYGNVLSVAGLVLERKPPVVGSVWSIISVAIKQERLLFMRKRHCIIKCWDMRLFPT